MSNFDFEKATRNQVIAILNRHAADVVRFELATNEQDTKQATDFVVTTTIGCIAVRVRRYKSTGNKYRDLTVRSRAMFGGKTEIDKLREGWGDLYLYCWEDEKQTLNEYMLLDIGAIRSAHLLEVNRKEIENVVDGTCFVFIPFDELYINGCVRLHTVNGKPGRIHRPSLNAVLSGLELLNAELMPLRHNVGD